MARAVAFTCHAHANEFECPDSLVHYLPRFDEYGLIIHDGGESFQAISYCPWCGSKLPESKRDRWFDELADLGIDDPHEEDVPPQYLSDAWYRES
jgi:hypothetical protein